MGALDSWYRQTFVCLDSWLSSICHQYCWYWKRSVAIVFIAVRVIQSSLFHFACTIQHLFIWACWLAFSWLVLLGGIGHVSSRITNMLRWANCWSVWCNVRQGWLGGSYWNEHNGNTDNTSGAGGNRYLFFYLNCSLFLSCLCGLSYSWDQ